MIDIGPAAIKLISNEHADGSRFLQNEKITVLPRPRRLAVSLVSATRCKGEEEEEEAEEGEEGDEEEDEESKQGMVDIPSGSGTS